MISSEEMSLKENLSAKEYQGSLSLLEKFSTVVENNPILKEVFLFDGYNLWQMYIHNIFIDIEKNFYGKSKTLTPRHSWVEFLKVVVFGVLAMAITISSWLCFCLTRRSVLIFSGDKLSKGKKYDERLSSVYQALAETPTPFGEILHTIPGKETWRQLLRRRRAVMYLEAFDVLTYRAVVEAQRSMDYVLKNREFTSLSIKEKDLLCQILVKYAGVVSITKMRVKIFSYLLQKSGCQRILMMDDVRHYGEILISARRSRIETYAIQHGHFTKYHVGWRKFTSFGKIVKPGKLLLWSKYWQGVLEKINSYFAPEDFIIAGAPVVYPNFQRQTDEMLTILIPYERDGPKTVLKEIILKLSHIKNTIVLYKVRPEVEETIQLAEYGLIPKPDSVEVITSLGPYKGKIDVALGTYSTLLYEMVALKIPVGILKTHFDYGFGMVENGLADFIDPETSIEEVKKLASRDVETLHSRRKLLLGDEDKTMRDTLAALIK